MADVCGKGVGAGETLDRVEAAIHRHAGDTEPFDDITLFALRRDD